MFYVWTPRTQSSNLPWMEDCARGQLTEEPDRATLGDSHPEKGNKHRKLASNYNEWISKQQGIAENDSNANPAPRSPTFATVVASPSCSEITIPPTVHNARRNLNEDKSARSNECPRTRKKSPRSSHRQAASADRDLHQEHLRSQCISVRARNALVEEPHRSGTRSTTTIPLNFPQ